MSDALLEASGTLLAAENHQGPGWRSLLFAPVGDGQRRRRGSDGLKLAVAVFAVASCVLLIRFDPGFNRAITDVIHPPPRTISWLVTVVYDVGAFAVPCGLVVVALLARRWEIARDIALAVAGAALASGLLVLFLGASGGGSSASRVLGYALSFPVLQIAAFMAVATAALPYLGRGVQRLIEAFIGLVALACAVGGHGLPVNVLGSLAIGWGVTALVHLIFGSPLGLPSDADVESLLHELGVNAVGVRALDRQVWGVAKFGASEQGEPAAFDGDLGVSVYGRDAADATLLSKVGRFVFYRDSGPSLTFTRLQQVEHEAYLTVRASQSGVAVPEVLEAGSAGAAKDVLLVYRRPPGRTLSRSDAAEISDAALDDVFVQLHRLREARIAHGAISGDTIVIDPAAQRASLTDFRNALSNADARNLDRDLAGAIAAISIVVGPERGANAAARDLSDSELAGALQHLRKAGLDPAVGRDLKGNRGLLEDVRERAALERSIEVPKLAEPRRVSWPTLIMLIGSIIGGWALIGVLINVGNSFDTIVGAEWIWVVLTFVLAQLAYVASAVEELGSVSGPLPFGRAVAVEIANCFSSLAGGTAAVFATRVRFYQQQGYDATVALSSGAIMTSSSWIAKGLVFAISLPLAWGSIHVDWGEGLAGSSRLVWIILAVFVGAAIVLGVVALVPKLRRLASEHLRPRIRAVWINLKAVGGSPSKVALLATGAFGRELLVAMALSVSLRAFGDHLRLPILIVVITIAGFIGGVAPTPGGMGVVEAGMILGLTAAGVYEPVAVAAVFIQRLFTSYLPPIWGWFTLVWMRKREYL